MQLLEGPKALVNAALERISRDDRHTEIQTLVSQQVSERMFGDWAMLHDPAKSWIWSAEDVSAGAIERAKPTDFLGVFEALSEKVRASLPK